MACPKCGSRIEIDGLRIIDRAESNIPLDLTVRVERNPGALLFKGAVSSKVEARACGGCGFLELYAKDTTALVRASRSRKKR